MGKGPLNLLLQLQQSLKARTDSKKLYIPENIKSQFGNRLANITFKADSNADDKTKELINDLDSSTIDIIIVDSNTWNKIQDAISNLSKESEDGVESDDKDEESKINTENHQNQTETTEASKGDKELDAKRKSDEKNRVNESNVFSYQEAADTEHDREKSANQKLEKAIKKENLETDKQQMRVEVSKNEVKDQIKKEG
jgi:vacuolar-type H+-ATPase subunit F/Vma7